MTVMGVGGKAWFLSDWLCIQFVTTKPFWLQMAVCLRPQTRQPHS
jgi:hypothetical protein